jgi:hypothetical protein
MKNQMKGTHNCFNSIFVPEDFKDQGFPRSTYLSKKNQEKLLKNKKLGGVKLVRH